MPGNLFPAYFIQKELFLVNPFLFLDNHLNNTSNNHKKTTVFHPPKQKLFIDTYMDLLCQFIVVARLVEHLNLRDKNALYQFVEFHGTFREGKLLPKRTA